MQSNFLHGSSYTIFVYVDKSIRKEVRGSHRYVVKFYKQFLFSNHDSKLAVSIQSEGNCSNRLCIVTYHHLVK